MVLRRLRLPHDAFVQLQAGGGVPLGRGHNDEAFWRAAAGKSFAQRAFGRTWSPMLEVLGARELARGARTEWDVVPQMQITLSARQHIMMSAGVRVPVTERTGRSTQALAYLLWDWFDGGLLQGW